MGPGIGWELETPTMPQKPPLLFLLMRMTCSDKRRKRRKTIISLSPHQTLIGQRSGYRLALSGIQCGVTNSARPHSENTKFFRGGVQDGKMEEVRSCH